MRHCLLHGLPGALVSEGGPEASAKRDRSPFSCWVVLRCGSGKIAGKVVGGPRAKYNEGITGSALHLSLCPAPPSFTLSSRLPPPSHQEEWPALPPPPLRPPDPLHRPGGKVEEGEEMEHGEDPRLVTEPGWRLLETGLELGLQPGAPVPAHSCRKQLAPTGRGGTGKGQAGFLGKEETDLPQ